MNWDAIAAIADLIGAFGVLASLLYLGTQIRQNTRWLKQQAFQLGTNEIRRWAGNFSGSQPSSELFLKGQRDFLIARCHRAISIHDDDRSSSEA